MLSKIVTTALILTAAVAAPAQARDKTKVGADGYEFVRKDFVMTSYQMTWTLVADRAALVRVGETMDSPATEGPGGGELVDLVRISRKSGTCRAWIIDPELQYDPAFVAHVTLHCMYGNWHRDNNIGPRGAGR